jgi:hypothetical protein
MNVNRGILAVVVGAMATAVSAMLVGYSPLSWLLGLTTLVIGLIAFRHDRHGQALMLVGLVVVQTLIGAFGEWTAPWVIVSIVLSALTAGVVIFTKTPIVALFGVLALDVAQLVWYVAGFEFLAGGLLYSAVLFPFVARLAAIALELVARRGPSSRAELPSVPAVAA